MSTQPSTRSRQLLVAIFWLPPVVCALLLALLRPADGSWPLLATLSALAALLFVFARTKQFPAEGLLALGVLGLVFWPELALRVAGFRYEVAGTIVSGGSPTGTIEARHDPELFWTLPPTHPSVNSHGFLEREFRIPKPPDVRRLLFFGDSCTQQGFPRLVERELNRSRATSQRFESVNLGIAGYSSLQGRAVAERWGEALEGDVVLVYFGWNDHWLARGMSDADRTRWSQRLISRLLTHSRTFQGIVRASGVRRPQILTTPRVDLDSYSSNLEAIGNVAERTKATVVLITAPSAHPRAGVPDYLVEKGFASSKEQVLVLHRRYNEQVRAVARRRGWSLLDLELEADQLEFPERIFMSDGIHFTKLGLRWIAERIASELVENPTHS